MKFLALLVPVVVLFALMPRSNYFWQHTHQHTHTYNRCSTNEKMEAVLKNDPAAQRRYETAQARILEYERKLKQGTLRQSATVYTIPVVVHILYQNSNQNVPASVVYEQLQILNQDYRRTNPDASNIPATFASLQADSEIEFCLATRDPNGNPTTGITRRQTNIANIGNTNNYYSTSAGGQDSWDPSRYLNIWVCEIDGSTLGFTYQPGVAPAAYDGVVIDYRFFGVTGALAPYNGGRTTTHEVGHWLGLQHIWGSGNGGCTTDDGITDTPLQNASYGGCPNHPQSSCGSNDMFMNYMDYVNDNCMNTFTEGQKLRMRATLASIRSSLQTSQGCATSFNDAGISDIVSPRDTLCDNSFTPVVTLRNYGASTLTLVNVNYRINSGNTQTFNWSGNLASNQSTTLSLPNQTLNAGSYTFEAWTSLPNGTTDNNTGNDAQTNTFVIQNAGLVPPFSESFENVSFPIAGWQLSNPDNNITWSTTTLAAKTGTQSLYMDNWDYPAQGQKDIFTMPAFDLSNSTTANLRFQVAYALYSSSGASDTLKILASTDCGNSWNLLYRKAGTDLITRPTVALVEFVPNSNEWRQESVDLSAYVNSEKVLLRFEHVNDYENNLYLDDIEVTRTPSVNVKRIEALSNWNIYPNPAISKVHVQVELDQLADLEVRLLDPLGREVLHYQAGAVQQLQQQFNLDHLPAGIYFVQLVVDGQTTVKQLIYSK